jgi:isopentenyl-diphosphate Delta-isomerase
LEDILILVNQKDEEVGFMPKMEVHEKGLLHRAFSILIFNKKGEMLLQQRARTKYHSPALWTNACCSHPKKDEIILDNALTRLELEMGFKCELHYAYKFEYRAEFENNLIEHELDHVFIGEFNEDPKPNKDEVENFKWISLQSLRIEITENPEQFTPWFKIIVKDHLKDFKFTSTIISNESLS